MPFKVIQSYRFWYQSKARVHILISGQSQLGPYLAPFQRYSGLNIEYGQFSLPTPIPDKIWGRSVMLGSAERGKARLRDRRTDRQLALAIPRYAMLRAVINVLYG